MREVHRVFTPGGRLLVHDGAASSEDQARSGCYRFSFGEMRRMVEEAGFRLVEVERVDPGPVLVAGEVESLAKEAGGEKR